MMGFGFDARLKLKFFKKGYKMENNKELTIEDLKTIVVVLRTVADMNVLSGLNLRPIADRTLWTLVNGIQFKE